MLLECSHETSTRISFEMPRSMRSHHKNNGGLLGRLVAADLSGKNYGCVRLASLGRPR